MNRQQSNDGNNSKGELDHKSNGEDRDDIMQYRESEKELDFICKDYQEQTKDDLIETEKTVDIFRNVK